MTPGEFFTFMLFYVLGTSSRVIMGGVFWHERTAFQWSAFGQSTAGNDVVAIIFISLFFFPPRFSHFLRRDLFS